MVKDFAKAYSEAENIDYNQFETIKTAPETPNLKTLETTILRYYEPSAKNKNTLFKEVDFNISKGKVLTTEQNDKFMKKSNN